MGAGFISSKVDYGLQYVYDPILLSNIYYDSFDKYNDFGVGVSLDYFVNLSFGLTIKSIDSKLSPLPNGEAKINAMDWGLLLNVPISKLAGKHLLYKPFENTGLKPVVNFSLGYSRSNIGAEVSYVDPAQKDPLPLTGRLGCTISFGADLLISNHSINIFTYDISIEAEDLLVSVDLMNHITYGGLLGDIDVWKNLIEWKQSDNVVLRKGQKISLFETISFLHGSFYNKSPYRNSTNGIIVSSNGIFKLLMWNFGENSYVKFVLDHFEIQYAKAFWDNEFPYYYASSYFPPPIQTEMEAITISFKGFIF